MNKYIDADRLKADIRKELDKEGDKDAYEEGYDAACLRILLLINSLQQEQLEVDLKKFTEKMDAWKARYSYPDNISIKATMAFTARMFYQYPNIARQWYDSLSKATMD